MEKINKEKTNQKKEKKMEKQSKWYVVTGVPSSGKTTVLNHLAKEGYKVVPEAARTLIDQEMAEGRSVAEIRSNERGFQRRVTALKIKLESELPLKQIIFLDRAMPDSIAYYALCGIDPGEALAVCRRNLYQKVFLMEPITFTQDYARTESPEAIARLNDLLRDAYKQLGYEVVAVPAMSVEDRVRFIMVSIR